MTKPKVSSDVERAQIDGSIYDGMMAAVSVPDPAGAGGLRTIAHCPRYDDALAIVTALNRISGGDEVTASALVEQWEAEWLTAEGAHWGDHVAWGAARDIAKRIDLAMTKAWVSHPNPSG